MIRNSNTASLQSKQATTKAQPRKCVNKFLAGSKFLAAPLVWSLYKRWTPAASSHLWYLLIFAPSPNKAPIPRVLPYFNSSPTWFALVIRNQVRVSNIRVYLLYSQWYASPPGSLLSKINCIYSRSLVSHYSGFFFHFHGHYYIQEREAEKPLFLHITTA